MSSLSIVTLSPKEWAGFSEKAHLVVFGENRPKGLDRIDYALLVDDDETIIAYATVKELDGESVYWQYGGTVPKFRGTSLSYKAYRKVHDWCFTAGYKRITTYVENTNIPMLKFSLKIGFIIIGTRTFKGSVYVELLKEKAC